MPRALINLLFCLLFAAPSASLNAGDCPEELYKSLFHAVIKNKTKVKITTVVKQNRLVHTGYVVSVDKDNITLVTKDENKSIIRLDSIITIESEKKRRFNPLSLLVGVGVGLSVALLIMVMTLN